ncbi:Cold shock domain-containing protein E1 [Amphibalanus amphitrite]|uniref:Cold shock domain-containing protein E1 n=1 Tax=Amphibalanus amphitrite TaxID=1232801 RepID=A0A6A4VZ53_AMPAM|nr:cold shock domain-containing protein E1-like isoform X1 [Amphibalanus amphitrite]KAF0294761.1 Cold shock domain-containing protein E1 [Amphibalanus amphitrite]
MSHNPQWNSFQPPSQPGMKSYSNYHSANSGYHGSYHGSSHSPPGPRYGGGGGGSAHYASQTSDSGGGGGGGGGAEFDIGVFSVGTFSAGGGHKNGYGVNGFPGKEGSPSHAGHGLRETGIIEKLLHSYGFIQCCDRQARLFFHFSQFDGTIEHLRVGDPVEFEMTYDKRTGKPIASSVSKITPEVTPQVLSEERVTGTVTTELTAGAPAQHGRISYENRGECFFLPYDQEDIEGNVTLRVGDLVSFQMATNPRTGNLAARCVRLENPANPIHYQGMVCSLQPDERSGFIERADVVREIVFSSDSVQGDRPITLGDEVEFTIQTVQGKEVATNIVHLEAGTVVFEDVDPTDVKGQVLKALDEVGDTNDPMPGRIRYRVKDTSEVQEVPFGERDLKGSFTLRHGDWVQFNVATDRRDKLQRATGVSLLDQSFLVSGEKREHGVLLSVKEHSYGFIRCVERDQNLFFHLSEMVDPERGLQNKDEVEFTVVPDPKIPSRQTAIRILRLPPGTVRFETVVQAGLTGTVTREPSSKFSRSPGRAAAANGSGDKSNETGLITYELDGATATVTFSHTATDPRHSPRHGDTVRFSLMQSRRTKELWAAEVAVTQRAERPERAERAERPAREPRDAALEPGSIHQGYVTALKDSYGFIETLQHDREIFFHYSMLRGDPEKIQLGDEVQYTLSRPGSQGRVSAENVTPLPAGTLSKPAVLPEVLDGIVLRPLRSSDPDQPLYAGLVQANTTEEVGQAYEFGITSLANKKDYLQVGDSVTFQVEEGGQRATNIKIQRKRYRATVDAFKNQYGFLSYEHEAGKKLFFHVSEVKDGVALREGDEVEFSVVTSHRSGKSSACQVVRISSAAEEKKRHNSFTSQTERPDRVIQRIRTMALNDQRRPRQVQIVRQPRGPDQDGGRGFSARRPAA